MIVNLIEGSSFTTDEQRIQLQSNGYVLQHHPSTLEDTGDVENGPELSGCDEYDSYTLYIDDEEDHVIIVQAGRVVDCNFMPRF